jgi:Lsr2
MARKTVVELIDDISGKPAQETVTFALDGMVYEIDLSAENADRLRSGLAPFLDKARKAGTPHGQRAAVRTGAVTTGRTARSREESADIRAWAKQHGIVVNERGRIPAKVIEAYKSGDASAASAAAAEAAEAVEAVEAAEPKPSVRPVPQATFQAVSNP